MSRKKNGLRESRLFSLLGGKELKFEEFDKRAAAMFRKHRCSEPAIAAHFAKLVAPYASRLFEAMRPLY